MIVLNIHHKHTVSDRIPKWATYFIFQFLPQWIFIQGPVKLEQVEKRQKGRRRSLPPEKTLSNTISMLQNTTIRRIKGQMNHKKSSLLASLAGSAGHEVRTACSEITSIADFLTAREANRKNVSEWHILAAVLDRILLILFSITLLTGSFFFYSEIGRHPVPEHPFWMSKNDTAMRNSTEYADYRGCNEYHTGRVYQYLYRYLPKSKTGLFVPNLIYNQSPVVCVYLGFMDWLEMSFRHIVLSCSERDICRLECGVRFRHIVKQVQKIFHRYRKLA